MSDLGEELIDSGAVQNTTEDDDAIINESNVSAAIELEVEIETDEIADKIADEIADEIADKIADKIADEEANKIADAIADKIADELAEGEEEAAVEQQSRRVVSPIAIVEQQLSSRSPLPPISKSPVDNRSPMTPTTQANLEPSATVKYLLEPSKQVITIACSLKTSVGNLRSQLASQIKMSNPDYILLFLHDEVTQSDLAITNNQLSLANLNVAPNGLVQFKVVSSDPEKHPIGSYEPPTDTYAPPAADFITVRVVTATATQPLHSRQSAGGGGESQQAPAGVVYKEINVEIERLNHKKPFLGGYRNKLDNKEFHNAAIQTNRLFKPDNGITKYCRDTQTIVSHHIKIQTRQDMSTQMTKPGVFVSRIEDKLLTPRPYLSADELEKIRIRAAIILQKYFRRWQAKRRFVMLKTAYEARVKWEREQEQERKRSIEKRREWDLQRRMQPRTRDDFEVVYAALERWRREECARIDVEKKGAARKAALAMLVDQEAELIGAIERCKLEAADEVNEKRIQALLDKMSMPKRWKYKDGTTTELDTPYNIRARELKEIYNSLNMNFLTQDERLDVLLTLKHTIKEHDCKLTKDIISLIDREADLLMRGIREENLQGLRKRIVTLFLQYIKTPQFNPAAARVLKVPQDLNVQKTDTFYCTTCQRYLPSHEFQVSSSSAKMGKCRTCSNLENVALKRIDYTKFRHMLNRIQRDEQNYGSQSTICYLLTERDIHYLFETIWNSQSVLSANDDVYQLHFVRWDKNEEWTPWNTILLTLEEAEAHLKLTNLEFSYGESFIKKIKQKHVSARSYFLKLPTIAKHFNKLEMKSSTSELRLPSLTGIKIN